MLAAQTGGIIATGKMTITVVDGERRRLARPFVRVLDADHREIHAHTLAADALIVERDIQENWRDLYTVQAFAPSYRATGFHPVRLRANTNKSVALMTVPEKCRYDFSAAGWDSLKAALPDLCAALVSEEPEEAASARYLRLQHDDPEAAAGLLNIATAMHQLCLSNRRTALSYLKAVTRVARDRFFGFAEAGLISAVQAARGFTPEPGPGVFHPGATRSYKQTQFDVGNVQLTFHEGELREIGGVRCVKFEPDMDMYKDLAAHGLFEVLPNDLTREPTDPKAILALRWMAAHDAGLPVFDPLYRVALET